jgi:hypothetical protein
MSLPIICRIVFKGRSSSLLGQPLSRRWPFWAGGRAGSLALASLSLMLHVVQLYGE